jgi:thioesterase domain-containing protein
LLAKEGDPMALSPERLAETRSRPVRPIDFEPGREIGPDGRPSLIALKPDGAGPALFMVPGQLGQVFHFKRLAERIRDDIPVYGFEARGLYGDEEPVADMQEMAANYIAEMRALQPHGPHLLGGFSVGGKIAYEMARQLHEAGDRPHLAVFDYGPERNANLLRGWRGRLMRPINMWKFHWQNYQALEGQRRAAYRRERFEQEVRLMLNRLRLNPHGRIYEWAVGAAPRKQAPLPGHGAVRRALRTMEENWEWAERSYPHRFTLFRARIQAPGANPTRTLGFDEHTAPGGVDVIDIPGHHGYMFVEPHVFSLLPELEDWIDRSTGQPGVTPSAD